MSRLSDLVHELIYQYPTGISTHSPCAAGCGQLARGGHVCRSCVEGQLRELGVSKSKISALKSWLRTLQELDGSPELREARLHIDRLRESITQTRLKGMVVARRDNREE